MKKCIYAVVFLSIFAFSVSAQISDNKTLKLNDDELIQEVVVKKILEPLQFESDILVIYLSIDSQNPSDNLLKKLSIYKLPVKKGSEFIDVENGGIILDETTYEKGEIIYLSKIKWKNKTEAKISGIFGSGNLGSQGCDYTLKKEDGKWEITSEENCFVS